MKPLPNFYWTSQSISGFFLVILHNLKIKVRDLAFQPDTTEIQGVALTTYFKIENFTFIDFVSLFGGGDEGLYVWVNKKKL